MQMLALLGVCLLLSHSVVLGVIPTGIIQTIFSSGEIIHCATGPFSRPLPQREDAMIMPPSTLIKPRNNVDGCRALVDSVDLLSNNFLWLVERGKCSFEEKATNAFQAGASGIIVYNSLKGIYQNKSYAEPIDYECNYGRGYVNKIIHPIWGDTMNEAMPDTCTKDKACQSGKCVFTNRSTADGAEVCCAFDMYMTMGISNKEKGSTAPIPMVFIRMQDVMEILNPITPGLFDVVMLYQRYEPFIDPGSILIWLLAVSIVAYASIKAATAEDDFFHAEAIAGTLIRPITPRPPPAVPRPSRQSVEPNRSGSSSASARSHLHNANTHSPSENSFEITPKHAVLWALCSGCMLVLLFYVNLYRVIGLIYVVIAAGASFLVVFRPLALSMLGWHLPPGDVLEMSATGAGALMAKLLVVMWMVGMYFGSIWLWVPQDIMGAAICIVGIHVIRLPNFKVATLLLGMMFFYDIFFVFISPYFFSSSVMMKVASGGKHVHDDENFCEKYPKDDDCKPNSLPMLLVMPSVLSYLSGGSILGLGDVVLPGLLVAFAARLDTRLFGAFHMDLGTLRLWLTGCFAPTLFAYAAGLLLANFAVVIFETGQPALLYINPLTLAAVSLWGMWRGCLVDLWHGPSVLYPEASNIVIVQEGEDQGLLDALPMAKKLHLANDIQIGRNCNLNSASQGGRSVGAARAGTRTERYQTMVDPEYLEEDYLGTDAGPI